MLSKYVRFSHVSSKTFSIIKLILFLINIDFKELVFRIKLITNSYVWNTVSLTIFEQAITFFFYMQ